MIELFGGDVFRFAQPGWAHALWAVAAWVIVVFVLERRGGGALDRLVGGALQERLVARPSDWRRRWRRCTNVAIINLDLTATTPLAVRRSAIALAMTGSISGASIGWDSSCNLPSVMDMAPDWSRPVTGWQKTWRISLVATSRVRHCCTVICGPVTMHLRTTVCQQYSIRRCTSVTAKLTWR